MSLLADRRDLEPKSPLTSLGVFMSGILILDRSVSSSTGRALLLTCWGLTASV
jgi:hypothetical protein